MAKRTFLRIEGLDSMVRDIEKAGLFVEDALITGVTDASEIVEADMQRRALALPYAEGDLAINTNIVSTFKDNHVVSALTGPGAKIDYAFFAEVGVRGNIKKPSQQYARPAVDKNKKVIRATIENAIGDAFERAVKLSGI